MEMYMKRIRAFLSKYILSIELPLEARIANMIFIVGFFVGVVDFVIQFIIRPENIMLIAIIGATSVFIAFMLLMSNRYQLYTLSRYTIIIVVCDILFPTAFFFAGGVSSGMAAYFVLSIAIIFILGNGKARFFFLVSHLLITVGCYAIGYRYPELLTPLTGVNQVIDHILTYLISGLCIGLLIIVQKSYLTSEMRRVDSINVALEEERQTRAAILDTNPHVTVLFDDQNRIVDCNPAFMNFLGFKNTEELTLHFDEIVKRIVPPVQSNGRRSFSLNERIDQARRDGSVQFENQLYFEDKVVNASVILKRIPYKDSYGIVGYLVDLTELYTARDQLLHREALLMAVNTASEMLIGSDPLKSEDALSNAMALIGQCVDVQRIYIWQNEYIDGALHYVQRFGWTNPEAERALSSALKEQTGFSYIGSIPAWEQKFAQNISVNGSVDGLSEQERSVLSDFGIKSILVVPIFMQDEFWGFVSFDDCYRVRTFVPEEESILRSSSLLMANALIRTSMMKSLVQARQAAEDSARAKSDFLANMSHEIRTPLNAVIGMTSIGKSAKDTERKDYCFGKIEDASNHLLGVINDILDMSKIEANKLELSPVTFFFEKMLQRVVNVVNFRIDERRQHFTIDIDHHIPVALVGDSQRLAQVITNLLSNAIKFTPEDGSIRLAADLAQEEEGVCTVRITVSDTGIGISAEQQKRLFTSFQQADSSTSRTFGGTGLGLAISKRIVEMMGGEIGVESTLRQGSTFTFTFKARRGIANGNGLLDPKVNWENLHILAVDDDEAVREYFEEVAHRFGIHCNTAKNGEEALHLLKEHGSFDIYFVDWKMPDMDGLELSKRIKTLDKGKSIVTMISAYEWESLSEKAHAAGVDKFLPKPLFPSAIADLISECLGEAASVTQAKKIEEEDHDFSGCTALLVEDVEINREIVIALLEKTGLWIECAENGAEAVSLYKADPRRYDLIFMDLQMPIMDGYEATLRIRAFESDHREKGNAPIRIPIIAMTANVFKEDIERCFAVGMDRHIGKPLDFTEVLTILRTLLQ
jgi:PAS domain S-box-containing protein